MGISKALIPSRDEIAMVQPDYSSITDSYKGKNWTIPVFFIKNFVKRYNLGSFRPDYGNVEHYFSNKGSPFGKSSLGSLKVVLLSYPVLDAIYRMLAHRSEKFSEFYTLAFNRGFANLVTTPNGKLSIIEDSELKKRVIAMVDYHSQ